MKKTSTILAIGSGLFLGQAQAEIESEFHVGYNSDYVFRGVDFGSDAYEYGFDVAGSCECGLDWSAGVWHISPDQAGRTDDELDVYASVSKDLGFGSVAVGFTNYQYDGAQDDAEVYLSLAAEPFAGLEAALTTYFGVDGAMEDQVLLEGSLGYTFELSSKAAVNLGLIYGYVIDNGAAGNYTDGGSAYASATVSVDVALSDEITFSPYVSYIDADDDVFAAGTNLQEGLIGGAKLSFAF